MAYARWWLALWLALSGNAVTAGPALIINVSHGAPLCTEAGTGFLELLYKELFKQLGIEVQLQLLPAERSLVNANLGIEDGDAARVAGLEDEYPNLIRVPEPVIHYQHAAFTRALQFKVAGPASLKPYDVGIITGWKILEQNITGTHSLTKVENGQQLFSLLAKGRIEVAVIERMEGLMWAHRLGLQNVRPLNPAVLEGEWYLYLNKKHRKLVPAIAAELAKMKQDGRYQRIYDATLKQLQDTRANS